MSEEKNKKPGWYEAKYGSRRGFFCTCWYRMLLRLGMYKAFRNIDWSSVERIVFVCKGNICRSAYAEAVAASLGVDAISCGVDTVDDAPANKRAIDVAGQLGQDLTAHRTTQASSISFRETDLLVAMEPWQCKVLQEQATERFQCTLLGLWAREPQPYIHDPYGLSSAYFVGCFTDIQYAVNTLTEKRRSR